MVALAQTVDEARKEVFLGIRRARKYQKATKWASIFLVLVNVGFLFAGLLNIFGAFSIGVGIGNLVWIRIVESYQKLVLAMVLTSLAPSTPS